MELRIAFCGIFVVNKNHFNRVLLNVFHSLCVGIFYIVIVLEKLYNFDTE